MPQLVNKKTGAIQEFPSQDEVEFALDSGLWESPQAAAKVPPKSINVVNQSGSVFSLKPEDVADYQRQSGEELGLAPQAYNQQAFESNQIRSEAENLGRPAAAALAFGRGASFGLSGVVADVTGVVPYQQQQAYKSAFPVTNVLAEGAGIIAGGIAGAAEKGAARFLPSALASRAAANVGGKSLAKVAAIEGGLYGLTTGFADAAIDDKPFTGETLASIAIDTGLQAGAGALLGGGISLLGKVASKIKPRIATPAPEVAPLTREAVIGPAVSPESTELSRIVNSEIRRFDPAGGGPEELSAHLASRPNEPYTPGGGFGEMRFNDLVDQKAFVAKEEKFFELIKSRDPEAYIQKLRDFGATEPAEEIASEWAKLKAEEALITAKDEAFEAMAASWKKLELPDNLGKLSAGKVEDLVAALDEHLINAAKYQATTENVGKQAFEGMSHGERDLGVFLGPQPKNLKELMAPVAMKVSGKPELPFDDLIKAAGYNGPEPQSSAAKAMLATWALHQSPKIVRTLEATEKVLVKETEKAAGNVIKDVAKAGAEVVGAAKFVKNAANAVMTGNPVATVKTLYSILTRGRQGLSKTFGLLESVGKRTRKFVPPAIDKITSEPGRREKRYGSPNTGSVMRKAKEVVTAASDPQLDHKLERKYANYFLIDPEVASKAMATEKRVLQSLAAAAPREPSDFSLGQPRWFPSMDKVHSFAEQYAFTIDPIGRFNEKFSGGKLTAEDVNFLKTHFPDIHQKIVSGILDRQDLLKENSSYEDRLQLAIITGIPADAVLEPEFMATLQANFVAAPEAQPNAAIPANKSLPASEPTAAQKYSIG